MIGRTLGRYRVLESLGEGGMGRVYLAEDPTLGRQVAIKVLSPEAAGDVEQRRRLVLEARAASALNHPNILTIHDLGDEDGVLYVAMERVEGRTLRDWAARGAHPPADVLRLLRQATRALTVAHAAGLVHRDLKPENLMVRDDGLVKILDFGLARSTGRLPDDATVAHTMAGTILGTAPYMSPEQVLGRPAGPASDVFSMGTLLYELLTGTHPFTGESAVDTMHRILHEAPAPPSRLAAAVPPALDFVVLKALAKDPARRYATARELDVDLETCEDALTPAAAVAARPHGASEKVVPRAIAVLPFRNIGGSAELNHLGLGLADAVINRLSSSPDLVVRATSSIGRYEGTLVEPAQVARELDVVAVLDASFQRAGQRLRATARLVDPEGRALWAGKVDVDFDDVFEVQDQVASGISTALTARLVVPAGSADAAPRDPRAFDLFLRSTKEFHSGKRGAFERAIGFLEEAVRVDPGFVDAWARLATVYHSMFDSGFDPDPIWLQRAATANARARALDPHHPEALFLEGATHLVAGRKPEAYRALVESHRRLPNDPGILHYLAYLFRLCAMGEAFEDAELRSIELDPSRPWPYWTMIRVELERGRVEQARMWLERAQLRFPDHPATLNRMWGLWLEGEGRAEDVLRVMEQAGERVDRNQNSVFLKAHALAFLGRREEARALLLSVDAAARLDMDFSAWAALIEVRLGDPDAAFRWLERAVELGNDSLHFYENGKAFGPLYSDPRWPAFLAGVKERAARWRREFAWPV